MLNLVIGILFLIVGAWGILANWFLFWDVLKTFLFVALIGFGVVAIMAGIKKSKEA